MFTPPYTAPAPLLRTFQHQLWTQFNLAAGNSAPGSRSLSPPLPPAGSAGEWTKSEAHRLR